VTKNFASRGITRIVTRIGVASRVVVPLTLRCRPASENARLGVKDQWRIVGVALAAAVAVWSAEATAAAITAAYSESVYIWIGYKLFPRDPKNLIPLWYNCLAWHLDQHHNARPRLSPGNLSHLLLQALLPESSLIHWTANSDLLTSWPGQQSFEFHSDGLSSNCLSPFPPN
jgi:hypothetical protein